ncbi:hypothetical protein BDN67DRAFT_963612 [Paxillus ammoniavirescens]|nr:hypothetical protein BDN67DRAFT_963612 [Paxillus ammoniavirescens]
MEAETNKVTSENDLSLAQSGQDEAPQPPSEEPPQPSGLYRTLEDVLAQPSTALVREFASSISQSAMEEANKTELFRKELRKRLFQIVLKTYSWSNARLVHETNTAERALERDVQDVLSTEREQGMSSRPPPTIFGTRALLEAARLHFAR